MTYVNLGVVKHWRVSNEPITQHTMIFQEEHGGVSISYTGQHKKKKRYFRSQCIDGHSGCGDSKVKADTLLNLKSVWKTLNGEQLEPTDFQGVTCVSGQLLAILITQPFYGSLDPLIGDLPTLAYLSIQSQMNGSIPSTIGNLSNLMALNLGVNQLSGHIPDTICQLTQLGYLNLGTNLLEGNIPPCIGGMTKLYSLYLDNNTLSGSIPTNFGNLVLLTELTLHLNKLTGFLPPLSSLNRLRELWLSQNKLTGDLSTWPVGKNFSQLNTLVIDNNNLTGLIPDWIGDTSLKQWKMENNHFYGTIPSSIGQLVNLTYLSMYNNQLSGTIPRQITNLKNLITLYLDSNQLNGTIPEDIGNLSSLKSFYLYNNRLTGNIPSSIENMISLENLDLSGNQLTGGIPSSIGDLKFLTDLSLQNNRLDGSIPDVFSDFGPMYFLFLQGNQLSGPIPASVSNLRGINFDLSNNLLNGTLSSGWAVTRLNISHNRLVGQVPRIDAMYIDVSHNRFSSIGVDSLSNYGSCDLTYNEFPCVPAQPSKKCNVTCHTSVDEIYNSSSSITVDRAQTILNQVVVPLAQLPGIVSAITSSLLKNTSSFSLQTKSISLYVNTYNGSSVNGVVASIPSTFVSATFPPSVVSSGGDVFVYNETEVAAGQITVAISTISSNPFSSVDNTMTYGNVIGVTVYDREREVDVTGTELINITMGILPSSFPSSADAECLWWQETEERWQREGCNATVRADEVIVCQCNHLTNFTLGARTANSSHRNESLPLSPKDQTTVIIIAACVASGGVLLIVIVSLIVFLSGVDVTMTTEKGEKMKIEYENVIHRGDFSEIWKGKLDETTTIVIKKKKGNDGVNHIAAEATTLKGMHHPNIILYIGQDLAEGYYVMEYMNGGSLQQYMAKQALDASSVFIIAADVTKGLSYLTSIHMTHTHLTPEKVLLSVTDGEISAKISGVSHARSINSRANPNSFGVYTAPEVIESGTYQASSDVWSFGVLLFAMATNDVHLYDRHVQKKMVNEIKCGELKFSVEEVDEMMSTLIAQCTRREVELRLKIRDAMGRLTHPLRDQVRTTPMERDHYGVVDI
ncbi:hypothetical protein PROFUN_06204 [Planoprotostelium fungivorum]|uniref:LRR receptor-like serine/threonine-protein kinase n=1 Tax=Planoprotostelium fungivorum TaxID=1890364 RepID=A0A2P6MZ20_9EUKA|nr:hypothetical protein PROFUN_06204 [Planoprotostelium fungivorum]